MVNKWKLITYNKVCDLFIILILLYYLWIYSRILMLDLIEYVLALQTVYTDR